MSSSEDNDWACVVCYQLALDPHGCINPNCGRIVCLNCYKKKTIQLMCPICREKDSIKPNPALKRQMSLLKVKCKNKCGKRIRRRSINDHLKYCKIEKVIEDVPEEKK